MRTEVVTLKQAVEIMGDLELQDQAFTQMTDQLTYSGLLDRLRAVGSASKQSIVFLFGAGATQHQQLKRIRRNKGAALGDMTVYAVEVTNA
ncbi:hypothetical protein AO946_23535 [Pseudomonas aeruginosa]|uniref:hypothetical protein n=1 Tax=Pseudomonas aeruginosa TaxID=287 RepID=UPI00071BEBBE|nr:hypothetical protein [Pseudomonas aeruginosa]KSG23138.1 hypothetical protein AO946_23535 [Pseudomonas aeruginosa]